MNEFLIEKSKIPRPHTPYYFYSKEQRPIIKRNNPQLTQKEQSKLVKDSWKELDNVGKAPYIALSNEEKIPYQEKIRELAEKEERRKREFAELRQICAENNETLNNRTELLYACKYNKPTLANSIIKNDVCRFDVDMDGEIIPNDNVDKFFDNEAIKYACDNNMTETIKKWLDKKNGLHEDNLYEIEGYYNGNDEDTDGHLNNFNYIFHKLEQPCFQTIFKYLRRNNISGILDKLVTVYKSYYKNRGCSSIVCLDDNWKETTATQLDERIILNENELTRSTNNAEFLKDYIKLMKSYVDKRKLEFQNDIKRLQEEINYKRESLERDIKKPLELISHLSNWEHRNKIIKFRKIKRTASGLGN